MDGYEIGTGQVTEEPMKALTLILAATGVLASSQEKAPKRELKNRIEIGGRIVCVGCTLEKEAGADAQCTLHSKHAQGLQGSDGLLYTFLEIGRAHV